VITVIVLVVVAVLLVAAVVLWLLGGSDNERTVKESALTGVLLTKAEAGTALGTQPLIPDQDYGGAVETTWDTGAEDPCNFVIGAQRDHTGGSTAVRRQYLKSTDAEADKGKDLVLTQAVVAFPDAEAAQQYVDTIKAQWHKCVGMSFDVQDSSDPSAPSTTTWHNGAVSDSNNIVSWQVAQTGADADGWTCHKAIAARSNVVVEIEECDGKADAEFVAPLVAKISEKIDKAAQPQQSSHRHFHFFHHHRRH
jgi:hypothetical protein